MPLGNETSDSSPLTTFRGGLSKLFVSGLSLDLVRDRAAQEICVL